MSKLNEYNSDYVYNIANIYEATLISYLLNISYEEAVEFLRQSRKKK